MTIKYNEMKDCRDILITFQGHLLNLFGEFLTFSPLLENAPTGDLKDCTMCTFQFNECFIINYIIVEMVNCN